MRFGRRPARRAVCRGGLLPKTIGETVVGIVQKRPAALHLFRNLILGSLPLLAVGYLLGKRIKAQLLHHRPSRLHLGWAGFDAAYRTPSQTPRGDV